MIPKSTAEVQKATLDEFIKGWASWTPDGFLSTWAEGCTQQNLPFSAKSEVKTRPFVENFFPVLMSILTNFEVGHSHPELNDETKHLTATAGNPQCRSRRCWEQGGDLRPEQG